MIKLSNFDHHYIDELGNVLNKQTNRILAVWINVRTGYPSVTINEFGKAYNRTVHSLLATTFIPNPENKRTVNHKDGNKLNNSLSNLEWNTDSENMKHAYDHHLNHQRRKLTPELVEIIYNRFLNGEYFANIIKDYDTSASQVSYWINRYVDRNNCREQYETELLRQKRERQSK